MQRIEFNTTILENGYIVLPAAVREQLELKPEQAVKITIEIEQIRKSSYSFEKVRNLLKGIKGEMSAEVIAEREDRI